MQIPAEEQALLADRALDSTRLNSSRTGAPSKSVMKLEGLSSLATSSPIVSARIAFRIRRSVSDSASRSLSHRFRILPPFDSKCSTAQPHTTVDPKAIVRRVQGCAFFSSSTRFELERSLSAVTASRSTRHATPRCSSRDPALMLPHTSGKTAHGDKQRRTTQLPRPPAPGD